MEWPLEDGRFGTLRWDATRRSVRGGLRQHGLLLRRVFEFRIDDWLVVDQLGGRFPGPHWSGLSRLQGTDVEIARGWLQSFESDAYHHPVGGPTNGDLVREPTRTRDVHMLRVVYPRAWRTILSDSTEYEVRRKYIIDGWQRVEDSRITLPRAKPWATEEAYGGLAANIADASDGPGDYWMRELGDEESVNSRIRAARRNIDRLMKRYRFSFDRLISNHTFLDVDQAVQASHLRALEQRQRQAGDGIGPAVPPSAGGGALAVGAALALGAAVWLRSRQESS